MRESGWLARLKAGLSKTSQKLGDGITEIFVKQQLDQPTLDRLEELLIEADVGVATASRLVEDLSRGKFDREITAEEVKRELAGQIEVLLAPVAQSLVIDKGNRPHVILVVGVNGTGKTTTIGKLAHRLKAEGYSLMLAAADTFRAAAVEQLKIWGERNGSPVIAAEQDSDPASVAYKALEQAKRQETDVLLIDSAGRLQNKANLMGELQKIIKVMQKLDMTAPHSVLLVLDATTGQNAVNQVEVFRERVKVTGLVVTKLDGTAKGGVVLALARKYGLPIHAIGVGEGAEDFREFSAQDFARNLAGLNT